MNPLEIQLKTLNQELELFLALLEEESIALASDNSEHLERLTHQRHKGSQNLAELWQQLAEQLGLPADAGLPAFRLCAFSDSDPSQDWLHLEKLTHAAAHLNRINGRLIEEQMRRTQAAMQVLQSASTRSLYGSDGRLNDTLIQHRNFDSA
jgi:flagellar biosynthesis/type III secretory pathway chaperone